MAEATKTDLPDANPTPPDPSSKEGKEILKNFSKYDQQCIMIKELNQFLERLKIRDPENGYYYDNLFYLKALNQDEIRSANNIIHGSKYFMPFINVPNHILSALVPKIRLYKSYILDGGQKFDIELPMEDKISQEDILSEHIGKGFGYGLESFSWENTSFNEFDRNISATLIMKFSNLDSFTKVRTGIIAGDPKKVPDKDEYKKFSFLELIYQVPAKVNASAPDKDLQADQQVANPRKFKIKISIGWEFEDSVLNNLQYTGNLEALKKAIKANNYVLYLYNKGHDLQIDQQGRVTVSINYQSAQEARINDETRSNILANTKSLDEIQTIQKSIEEKSDEQKLRADDKEIAAKIQELEKELELKESNLNFEIYSDFLDKFFEKGLINFCKLTDKDILKLKTALYPSVKTPSLVNIKFLKIDEAPGVQQKYRDLKKKGKGNETDVSASIEELKKTFLGNNVTKDGTTQEFVIPYFYFGDLLDLIIENINITAKDDKANEPLRLITGPIIYERIESSSIRELQQRKDLPRSKKTNVTIKTNIADLPISLELFLDWFNSEIVAQRRRTVTLRSFLSSVLSKFIVNVLGPSCFGKSFVSANPKTDIHILNVVEQGGKDPLKNTANNGNGLNEGKIITVKDLERIDQSIKFSNLQNLNIIPYLYMQIYYSDIDYPFIINENLNAQQGTYHLKMGVDRGLVKQINFAKDDNPAMPVLIYSKQGTVNSQILRAPYNAEVSMVGNTIFKPGSTVYIDAAYTLSIPSTKAGTSEAIQQLGLGGFYIVYRTKNVIQSGKFSTEIGCRFTNYGILG